MKNLKAQGESKGQMNLIEVKEQLEKVIKNAISQ